jgi:hypothetical protein
MNLISTEIKTTGFIYLGEQDKYGGYHQPVTFVNTFIQYPISLNNNSQMLGYNPLLPLPIPLIAGYNPLTIYEEPSEETFVGIYVCFDAYYYGNSFITFDKYTGGIQFVKQSYGGVNPYLASKPVIRINGSNGNYALYRFELAARYVSKNKYYRYVENTASLPVPEKPNYLCFANGYYLDGRTFPSNPQITPAISGIQTIGYYQKNDLEGIPDLTTIEWREYQIECKKNQPIKLPIYNLVLGTLYCSPQLEALVSATATTLTQYSWSSAFPDAIPAIFAYWMSLYNPLAAAQNNITPNTTGFSSTISTKTIQVFELDRVVRRISANNNYWQTTPIPELDNDLNPLPNHPMFLVDTARTYDYHFSPQTEGIGSLNMDSPRTIEIRAMIEQLTKALQAQNYLSDDGSSDPNGQHTLDWFIKNSAGEKVTAIWKALGKDEFAINGTVDRISTLAWYIKSIAKVLGIRVKPDGTIDETAEKTINRRLHVDGSTENNTQEFNPNCFGSGGMLVRHIPNKFSPKGTEAGGYRKVKDIPQLLAELHEQANAAMGYQEGTAIEIQLDGQTYRYANQLALLTELFVTAKQTATYSKGAFFSSVVGEQSIKEVMAGLGLRTVDKFLEFKVAGKTAKLYYKGISASQSIRRKLSAVTTNIGIAIGNII